MSYTLYGFPGSASFGPQALMDDAGLSYTKISVDIHDGSARTPEFVKLSPGGYVPVLVLEDGTIMYESAAIMLFLADFHDLGDMIPRADETDRAILLRTLFFLTSTVQECYKHYYYAERFTTDEADIPHLKASALKLLEERWGAIEERLEKSGPYVLGDRFSLVDIYVTMLASWHPEKPDFYPSFPAVTGCRDLVTARPRLADVIREHGIIPEPD